MILQLVPGKGNAATRRYRACQATDVALINAALLQLISCQMNQAITTQQELPRSIQGGSFIWRQCDARPRWVRGSAHRIPLRDTCCSIPPVWNASMLASFLMVWIYCSKRRVWNMHVQLQLPQEVADTAQMLPRNKSFLTQFPQCLWPAVHFHTVQHKRDT